MEVLLVLARANVAGSYSLDHVLVAVPVDTAIAAVAVATACAEVVAASATTLLPLLLYLSLHIHT